VPKDRVKRLAVVLGDQLDPAASFLEELESTDAVWMCESIDESTHVPSHKVRSVLFLSAMRHFRDQLIKRGIKVVYHELQSLSIVDRLAADLKVLRPQSVRYTLPGDWRLVSGLRALFKSTEIEAIECNDPHFWVTPEEFTLWAKGRKVFRLEHFYRHWRRQTGVLMDGDEPMGGEWNYDHDNRHSFDKRGPGLRARPRGFKPDAITTEVIALVSKKLTNNPGDLNGFDWPVTRQDALLALRDFIEHRLPEFGRYQDAMWAGEDVLYHSRLSAALNLKLLNPREVVAAAEKAARQKRAPLAAVEGFIRQILGWREYVRGIYYLKMPHYKQSNHLKAHHPLPAFYWTGETDFACLKDVIGHTLQTGYSHHIERLMVTGLFSLLWGTDPEEIQSWFLSMYVDAVEWVELPNVVGMSQYADGGLLASKPYIASGQYIDRMSNHCDQCPYSPKLATGPNACPFTTLYWNFIDQHATLLAKNPRLAQQVRHWNNRSATEQRSIKDQAKKLRQQLTTA